MIGCYPSLNHVFAKLALLFLQRQLGWAPFEHHLLATDWTGFLQIPLEAPFAIVSTKDREEMFPDVPSYSCP
jgi:hypothetical protein